MGGELAPLSNMFKIKGKINVNSKGVGYLEIEDAREDVRIDPSLLGTALHGDEVEAILLPKKKKERQQGEVIRVLKRAKMRFVGTIEKKSKNFSFLIPDDGRMYVDIFLPGSKGKNKEKALVELIKWDDPKKNPEGKILKIIGQKGDNEAELCSIVLEKGLSIEFPEAIKKEAQKASKRSFSLSGRRDFRGIPTFTIDPEDAKDYDDALSVREIEKNLYEVGVHIADVSHYVKEKSALDKEARKRAFSIYLVDRTIPMLPDALSNEACSLKPNEDRAAFSAVFEMTREGKVQKAWFGETVILSQKRFNYKEAQKVLDQKKGPFYKELSFLGGIAKKLREERIARGALDLEEDELSFKLDHDGRPLFIFRKENLFTHKLVEELMVLANCQVASRFNTLYRIHEKPDRKTINDLLSFLVSLGYHIPIKGKEITPFELNKLFSRIKGKNEEFLVKNTALRAMSKAAYSTHNKKHFGLSLEKYTHFTSPIRRYADLTLHRIVKKKLQGKKVNSRDYEAIAKEISLRELDVLDAERASVSYKQVEYMLKHVGKNFEAIISGVTRFGVFIQETKTKAEGMVPIHEMEDDYYILDEENYSLIGTRKRKRYSLGAKVKVKLVGGSLERRRLEFIFT